MTPRFWVALKTLTQDEDPVCWHCRGTSYHIFSLSAFLSLFALRPSSSLCIANTRLPPRNIFRALSPVFSSGLWKRGRGENRWIKRGGKMKREWDTALRQWHWQRALSSVQGNKIGSCCRRTLIWILFFVLFCLPFFRWLCMCLWECACVEIFLFLCAC